MKNKSGFVDSGFVKTCDEFVIGLVALQNSKHLLPQWMQLTSNIPPILELSSENLRTMIYIVQAYIVLAPNEFVATCGASVMKPLDEQYGKQINEKRLIYFQEVQILGHLSPVLYNVHTFFKLFF